MAGERLTVAIAQAQVAALTGDAARVASLIDCCLNAKAALHMLGCVSPTSKRKRKGFLPVGVQTLVQIEDLLATMPDEVALVEAAESFSCELCGCPAESSGDDAWFCDACIKSASDPAENSAGQPSAEGVSTAALATDEHPTSTVGEPS